MQGDGFAGEAFELTDEVAFAALGGDAGLVEVRAEVVVAGVRVGQQVPDDGQDGVAEGDDGAFSSAPSCHAGRARSHIKD
ncbi:hypothetical protein [Nonomuraea sp. LPB2021202275-12-8]|uniref:hypothetical protein n=1 Tax=Nonomuraea sp. LPB2021202275-12-8 TaxID=3120159 RepID=UPI00300C3428